MSIGASRLSETERRSHRGSRYRLRDLFTTLDTLQPKRLLRALDRIEGIASDFFHYTGCDWPMAWTALRSRFERRPNFGQWLAEIGSYYAVPGAFRAKAMAELAAGIDSMITLSPSLRAVPAPLGNADGDDEEFMQPSIFPFTLLRHNEPVPISDTSTVHCALARDLNDELLDRTAAVPA